MTAAQRYAGYKNWFLGQHFEEAKLMPFEKWQRWTDRIPDAVVNNMDLILVSGKTQRRRRKGHEHRQRVS